MNMLRLFWRVLAFAVTRPFLTILVIIIGNMVLRSPGLAAHLARTVFGLGTLVAVVGAVVLGIRLYLLPSSETHGSASFATASEIRHAGLRKHRGLIIGRDRGGMLRFNRPGHLLTFAPTRSGKGVGCVIPNLLDHRWSAVVTDIKGENHQVTAAWRATLGPVHALAPFSRGLTASRFNPLDFVRVGIPEEVDDAAMIADLLVVPGGGDTFWESEAQNLITTLILHVAHEMPKERRNLHEVWALLMQDEHAFRNLMVEMADKEHRTLSHMAKGFLQKEERERSGVVSTAQTHMKIWKSPLLAAATEVSDFRLEDLRRRATTLYIIVPPDLLDVYRPFVRLMVGLAMTAMTRTHEGNGGNGDRVLFLLDEVASLGRMSPIEHGIGYLAGYDVTLWLFFQDLDQLQKTYVKWRSIIANCNVRQAFGVSDYLTAQELSLMLGHHTVKSWSQGHAIHSPFGVIPGSLNRHVHETGRALLTPDEVMAMKERQQLIFLQACRPILAIKIKYFAEPMLTRRLAEVQKR